MGELADAIINGELCEWCGVYLSPSEKVNIVNEHGDVHHTDTMPKDGKPYGTPVVCEDCVTSR